MRDQISHWDYTGAQINKYRNIRIFSVFAGFILQSLDLYLYLKKKVYTKVKSETRIGKSRDYLEADDNDASTCLIHKRSLITCFHAFLAFCVVYPFSQGSFCQGFLSALISLKKPQVGILYIIIIHQNYYYLHIISLCTNITTHSQFIFFIKIKIGIKCL